MNNVIPFNRATAKPSNPGDLVNHPAHYNAHPSGVECIDVIENLPCNPANVVKYIWRAPANKATDADPKAHPINKARWYQQREKVRRVAAMNQALAEFQQTGNAGGLVGQIGSLINTCDLLMEAIIVMGSTRHDLAVAAGIIQPGPPEALGAPAPQDTATNRAWKPEGEAAARAFEDALVNPADVNQPELPLFDHCHTGDDGPVGICGHPGPVGCHGECPDVVGQQQEAEAEEDIDAELRAKGITYNGPYAIPSPPVDCPPTAEENAVTFTRLWNDVAEGVHRNACNKGFWDKRQALVAAVNMSQGAGSEESQHVNDLIASQCIALINTELGEATDALRAGNPYEHGLEGVRAVEAELADVVIRIMDTAAAFKWDVASAIAKKIAFNASRPRMHGGKRF